MVSILLTLFDAVSHTVRNFTTSAPRAAMCGSRRDLRHSRRVVGRVSKKDAWRLHGLESEFLLSLRDLAPWKMYLIPIRMAIDD